ncbi:MAG: ATP-binding cassette domain-containing protein [Sulfurimonas sp.]|nr:ATP-binding cassette domain-containing protein [Sulfurimonas sp.]
MKINKLKIILESDVLVDITFDISSSLALVGQSGSGKSLTLKALLGMLPEQMSLELQTSGDFELVGGKSVGFIPQNPFTALSPLTKIHMSSFVDEERSPRAF